MNRVITEKEIEMKLKTLFATLILAFFSNFVAAAEAPLFYGQGYSFVVQDPAAFVAAMDAYRASPTGSKTPNTVVLSQNIVNGDYAGTHGVNVFYPDTASMDQSRMMNANSNDWMTFLSAIAAVSTTESENLFAIERAKVKTAPADLTNPVTMVYAISVTDGSTFMKAFNQVWNSEALNDFSGNVYFGRNIASGNVEGTHFISFVAGSMAQLLDGVAAVQSSNAMARYQKNVKAARTVEATNVAIQLKRWAAE